MLNAFKKLGKKILSISVTFTTILWSVGVAALLPAGSAVAAACPALTPGDMVKVKGAPAIYVLNNKLEVLGISSGYAFKTWRANYGGYISITDECYMTLKGPMTQPFYVNFRPGSYVIMRESSSQLYVVEPNNTVAKITPEAAKALYGASYKAMTLSNEKFASYVNMGADVNEAKAHPGMMLKKDGKYWYVDGMSKLREVTAGGFTANGFMANFARSATDAMIAGLAAGDKVEAEVKEWTDKTQTGGVAAAAAGTTGTTVAVPGGALSVALAADNPFAATIVSDGTTSANSNGAQAMINVLKLTFTAGSDGDVQVTGVNLKRGGVSADTDIGNMYLYDGETRVSSNPTIATNMVKFSKSSGLFTVAKGSSKSIMVKLDLKNAVSSGKTISFAVSAKEDVMSNSTSVAGSFPLAGNIFTTANVTDLGKLAITSLSPSAAGTVDPGTTNFEMMRLQMIDSNQDVELRKMMLTIVGSVNVGDLKNFSVWSGGTQIGATVAEMASDKTVMFDWMATPYVVTKGQTKILSVRADITGGTNRTFRATLQNSGDVITYDKSYGLYLKTSGTDSFTIVQPNSSGTAVDFTVNAGTLTQTLASDSPTGNIADGATNVTLAKFLWKANGEDIKVSSLNVSSTSNDLAGVLANVRLLVDGSQVGSTISTLTADGTSNSNSSGWGTFGNSFIIKAGKTAVVTVAADLTNATIAAADTLVTAFILGSSNAQGVVSLNSISTVAQTGNTLTVRTGAVSVAKNSSFGERSAANPNGTVNATSAKVGSFIITGGAGEDVEVSQIQVQDNTSTCIGTHMQNLTLKDAAGKQLGATVSNPSGSCSTANTYTFNISPAVTVAKGAQFVVDVYADLKAAYTTGSALIQYSAVSATGKDTGTSANDSTAVDLQANYISAAGTFMVNVDANTPLTNNYMMGQTDQLVAKYLVSASSTEGVNITQFVVSAKFSGGATGTMQNIRLWDMSTDKQIGPAVAAFSDTVGSVSGATTTYSHATFSGLNYSIPAGQGKAIGVKVDFTTFTGGGFATTGQTFQPVILSSYAVGSNTINSFTATGASSGSTLTPTISLQNGASSFAASFGAYATTGTLYRTKLTVAWAGDTPSGLSSKGSAQQIAKFIVTNLSNAGTYPAKVQLANFNFGTSISAAAGTATTVTRALTVYKDSYSGTQLATTNFMVATQTFASANSGNSALTDANFTDVEISSGSSQIFYVTLDTTDAAVNNTLSVRVGSGQITWTDDLTSNTNMGGTTATGGADLPLVTKTLSY